MKKYPAPIVESPQHALPATISMQGMESTATALNEMAKSNCDISTKLYALIENMQSEKTIMVRIERDHLGMMSGLIINKG